MVTNETEGKQDTGKKEKKFVEKSELSIYRSLSHQEESQEKELSFLHFICCPSFKQFQVFKSFLPNSFKSFLAMALHETVCCASELLSYLYDAIQCGSENPKVVGITCNCTYGSYSTGREFWPKCGPFLKKVEPSCDQT